MNELKQVSPPQQTIFGIPLREENVEQTVDNIIYKLRAGNIGLLKILSKEKALLFTDYLEKDKRNLKTVQLIQHLLYFHLPKLKPSTQATAILLQKQDTSQAKEDVATPIPKKPPYTEESLYQFQVDCAKTIPSEQYTNDELIQIQLSTQIRCAPGIHWYLEHKERSFVSHPLLWLEEAACYRRDELQHFQDLIAKECQKHTKEELCILIARCFFLNCPTLMSTICSEVNGWAEHRFEENLTFYHLLALKKNDDFSYFFETFPPCEGELLTRKNSTPLHLAAKYSHLEYLRFLLNKDYSPVQQDNLGNTPFHYLAKTGVTLAVFLQFFTEQQDKYPEIMTLTNHEGKTATELFVENQPFS